MKLIIGGQAQGKLKYALLNSSCDEGNIAYCQYDSIDHIFEKKIIYNLHELIRRLLLENIAPMDFIKERLTTEHIIICQEVGSGVVPIDKFEREYRDSVGEICCLIAEKSDSVQRIFCGIPIKIKG